MEKMLNMAKKITHIMLEPNVAKIFSDSKSLNEALRALAKIIQQHQKVTFR